MIHPSAQAIDFIFNRLVQEYFDEESIEFMKDIRNLNMNLNHNIMNIESKSSTDFYKNTIKKMNEIESKYSINLNQEIKTFREKFNKF